MPILDGYNQYAVSSNSTVLIINWDGHSKKGKIERRVFSVRNGSFLSDPWVNWNGKLYVGNYGPGHCSEPPIYEQYAFKKYGQLDVFGNHYVSTAGNVLVEHTFYHLDACRKAITAFNWNPINGNLSE